MKLLLTSIKAAILSSFLLSLYMMIYENVIGEIIPIFFLSVVITFFIASGMIFFTIMPFSLLKNDNTIIFKSYFPFYAIVFFCFCLGVMIKVNFEEIVVAFFFITYITAMQSWVWMYKPKHIKNAK